MKRASFLGFRTVAISLIVPDEQGVEHVTRHLGSIHQCFTSNFYTRADPKSAKKTDNLTVFFALLGSALVKAVCRTLMKLIPGMRVMGSTESVGWRDGEQPILRRLIHGF
jgi:hypothetical protein